MMDGDVARESSANDDFDIIGDNAEGSTSGGVGVVVSVEVDLVAHGDEPSISKRPVDEEFSKPAMNGDDADRGDLEEEGEIEHMRIENGDGSEEKPRSSAEDLMNEFGISLDSGVHEESANGDADQDYGAGEVVEEAQVAATSSKTEEASITLDLLSKDQEVESVPDVDGKFAISLEFDLNGTDKGEPSPEETQDIPEHIPTDTQAEETPKDILEDISKDTPELEVETTQDSAVDVSLDTSQDTSLDISQDISIDVCLEKVQEPAEGENDQAPDSETKTTEDDTEQTVQIVLEPAEEEIDQAPDSETKSTEDDTAHIVEVVLEPAEEEIDQAPDSETKATEDDTEQIVEVSLEIHQEPADDEGDTEPKAAEDDQEQIIQVCLEKEHEPVEEETEPTPDIESKDTEDDKGLTIEVCLEKEPEPAADETDQVPDALKDQGETTGQNLEDGSSSEQENEGYRPGLMRSKSNRLASSKLTKFETSSAHSSDSESSAGNKRHTMVGTGRLNMSRFSQFEKAPTDRIDGSPGIKRNAGTRAKSLKYGSAAVTSELCHVCQKRVYPMEKVTADTIIYHKTCFRCAECKKCLVLGKYAACKGNVFCLPHFKQNFKLKGNYDFTNQPATPRQTNGVSGE